MKNRKKQCTFSRMFSFLLLFMPALFSACSSAPKKPSEIFIDRNMAVRQLNLANQTAGRGLFEDALLILEDARRLALTTDDPSLRIKTAISRGNILFSMGRHVQAFQHWESAAAEGDDSGEQVLAALARIYSIRAKLVLLSAGADPEPGTVRPEVSGSLPQADPDPGTEGSLPQADQKYVNTEETVKELMPQLQEAMRIVRNDPPSRAVGYVTMGLARKNAGLWTEAENAVKRALSIHEKSLNLEDAAYDWFLIASIRSMAGNYDAALEALNAAIRFDRRAENGYGLASNWQAMGDVLKKAGRTGESNKAYRRAAEIYRAIGHNDRAEKAESK